MPAAHTNIARKPRLVVFAKAPFIGGAKTRLAAGIGKVHANRIYRAMVSTLLRNLQDPCWDIVLAVTPDRYEMARFDGQFSHIWPAHVTRIAQGDGDLSARLGRVFNAKGMTIVIGTDSPQIRRADIARAICEARQYGAVFGPAYDGGFWLVGFDGAAPKGAFQNVRWSSEYTLTDVVKNLPRPPGLLRSLIDVDNKAALIELRGKMRDGRG